MRREISRVSVLVLIMFLTLFTSTTVIQSIQADSLNADGRNARAIQASFNVERGAIIAGGEPIAQSVPSEGLYPWQRQYPEGDLYAAVTGYNTLGQGNTGLEGAMNLQLTGQADSQFLSEIERILTGRDPQGASVTTTIIPDAQRAAAEGIGELEGAAVAIDPETGEILAMYSSPSFDPNVMTQHDGELVEAIHDELNDDPGQPLQNRAIGGDLYFPGSVFKLVIAYAAFASGDYTADSEFDNPDVITLPNSNREVRNSTRQACGDGDDTVTLEIAMRFSCNIPFAILAQELGEDAINEAATELGYGQPLSIPTPVTPSQYPQDMDDAQLMLTGFGQYDVRVTPLQIAMTTAAIANGGEMMKPNLIRNVITEDLQVLENPSPELLGTPMTPSVAADLQDLMVDNVENGYSSNAAIPGMTVGGKTGTAENDDDGSQPFNLWFTGYAEHEGRSVAVAVVVVPPENVSGQSAGQMAAPIGKSIMEAVLNS